MKNYLKALIPVAIFTSLAFTPVGEIRLNDEGNAEYMEVVEVPNVTANDLYDRGIAWVNKYYTNPNGVLKKQDKAGGEIMGKARFKLKSPDKKGNLQNIGGFVSYTIKIQTKEGKCRYVIDRIRWEKPSYYDVSRWSDSTQTNYNKVLYNSFIDQTVEYFDKLTEDLSEYMRIGEAEKKDDW